MKISLNKDYAIRHLFVTVLMLGLGGWFAFDGLVTYSRTPAAVLYKQTEKVDAPSEMSQAELEAFKRQKTQSQYGFAVICLLAGAIVGLRLLKSSRFDFSFDENGFTTGGKTYTRGDIAEVDRSKWEKKSILTLKLTCGKSIVLDAWHHVGVKDFEATV